jgi:hypothetical protein
VSDYIEAPISNWLAAFDGRVLEIFTADRTGSARYHVSLMAACEIDGSMLTATFQRKQQGFWPFADDQRAQVESLVVAINAARGI